MHLGLEHTELSSCTSSHSPPSLLTPPPPLLSTPLASSGYGTAGAPRWSMWQPPKALLPVQHPPLLAGPSVVPAAPQSALAGLPGGQEGFHDGTSWDGAIMCSTKRRFPHPPLPRVSMCITSLTIPYQVRKYIENARGHSDESYYTKVQ